MKLDRKKKGLIMGIIGGGLVLAFVVLNMNDVIGNGWSWLFPVIAGGALVAVEYMHKRVDPEGYEAELKEKEMEDIAFKEISRLKISRTWGGTVSEFITAILLIASWILILRDCKSMTPTGRSLLLEIGGLGTVGAIWFHVSAYFHMTMGIRPNNLKQLKLCIYRKRALGIICGAFLLCYILTPNISFGTWFFIAIIMFMFGYSSKFFFYAIK